MITEQQADGLAEVINIGFSRAAASLSELTGYRVELDAPKVSVHPIAELAPALKAMTSGEVATVHQIFSGSVAGDAMLVLHHESAATLARLLTGDRSDSPVLDQSDRDVLVEVGNILLSACLGTFGNLLQVRITFAVPRLHLDALDALLDTLVIGAEELRYGLVIYTDFRLRDSEIGGYLVIVLGVASLDRLIQEVDKLA
jgi:chemotaxis protein CheC